MRKHYLVGIAAMLMLASAVVVKAADVKSPEKNDAGMQGQQHSNLPPGSVTLRPDFPIIRGEVTKIEGNEYIVPGNAGSEVRLRVGKETQVDGTIKVGDRIEAKRTEDGGTVYIKKLEKKSEGSRQSERR